MFVQIVGKGHINVNQIIMISSKNKDGKYMITLSHGGKFIITQKVRDEIIHAYDSESTIDMNFVNERLRNNTIIPDDKKLITRIDGVVVCPVCEYEVCRCENYDDKVKSDE